MRVPPPDVVAAAQSAQKAYGILASVSIAQWALESAWGTHCTGKFNFFGIKAMPGQSGTMCWTHEVVGGKSVACQQPFRDYSSLTEAFNAHAALLCGPRYAAGAAHKADASAFLNAIGHTYATDPQYAAKLIDLIRVEGFTKYDTRAAS